MFRAATPTHRRLRDHLVTIAVVTLGVDLICAGLAFLLEHHSQETEIKTVRQRRVLDDDSAVDGVIADQESNLGGRKTS